MTTDFWSKYKVIHQNVRINATFRVANIKIQWYPREKTIKMFDLYGHQLLVECALPVRINAVCLCEEQIHSDHSDSDCCCFFERQLIANGTIIAFVDDIHCVQKNITGGCPNAEHCAEYSKYQPDNPVDITTSLAEDILDLVRLDECK